MYRRDMLLSSLPLVLMVVMNATSIDEDDVDVVVVVRESHGAVEAAGRSVRLSVRLPVR